MPAATSSKKSSDKAKDNKRRKKYTIAKDIEKIVAEEIQRLQDEGTLHAKIDELKEASDDGNIELTTEERNMLTHSQQDPLILMRTLYYRIVYKKFCGLMKQHFMDVQDSQISMRQLLDKIVSDPPKKEQDRPTHITARVTYFSKKGAVKIGVAYQSDTGQLAVAIDVGDNDTNTQTTEDETATKIIDI